MNEVFHEGNDNLLPDSHGSFCQSVVSGQHSSAAWVSELLFHCLVVKETLKVLWKKVLKSRIIIYGSRAGQSLFFNYFDTKE